MYPRYVCSPPAPPAPPPRAPSPRRMRAKQEAERHVTYKEVEYIDVARKNGCKRVPDVAQALQTTAAKGSLVGKSKVTWPLARGLCGAPAASTTTEEEEASADRVEQRVTPPDALRPLASLRGAKWAENNPHNAALVYFAIEWTEADGMPHKRVFVTSARWDSSDKTTNTLYMGGPMPGLAAGIFSASDNSAAQCAVMAMPKEPGEVLLERVKSGGNGAFKSEDDGGGVESDAMKLEILQTVSTYGDKYDRMHPDAGKKSMHGQFGTALTHCTFPTMDSRQLPPRIASWSRVWLDIVRQVAYNMSLNFLCLTDDARVPLLPDGGGSGEGASSDEMAAIAAGELPPTEGWNDKNPDPTHPAYQRIPLALYRLLMADNRAEARTWYQSVLGMEPTGKPDDLEAVEGVYATFLERSWHDAANAEGAPWDAPVYEWKRISKVSRQALLEEHHHADGRLKLKAIRRDLAAIVEERYAAHTWVPVRGAALCTHPGHKIVAQPGVHISDLLVAILNGWALGVHGARVAAAIALREPKWRPWPDVWRWREAASRPLTWEEVAASLRGWPLRHVARNLLLLLRYHFEEVSAARGPLASYASGPNSQLNPYCNNDTAAAHFLMTTFLWTQATPAQRTLLWGTADGIPRSFYFEDIVWRARVDAISPYTPKGARVHILGWEPLPTPDALAERITFGVGEDMLPHWAISARRGRQPKEVAVGARAAGAGNSEDAGSEGSGRTGGSRRGAKRTRLHEDPEDASGTTVTATAWTEPTDSMVSTADSHDGAVVSSAAAAGLAGVEPQAWQADEPPSGKSATGSTVVSPARRPRGRPRKYPLPAAAAVLPHHVLVPEEPPSGSSTTTGSTVVSPLRRPRGRPRVYPLPVVG